MKIEFHQDFKSLFHIDIQLRIELFYVKIDLFITF